MASLEIMTADYEPLLSRAMTCRIGAANSAPGPIEINYPIKGVRADQLASGLLVRVRVSGDGGAQQELAPYVLRDVRVDKAGEGRESYPIAVWSGVQHAYESARKAMCHDNLFFGSRPTFTFLTGTPGRIIAEQIKDEAWTRLVMRRFAVTGDALVDAKRLPWLADYTGEIIRAPWDMNAAEIIDQLTEDASMEWDLWAYPPLDPDGTPGVEDPDIWSYLRIYNPGNLGRDLTSVMASAGAAPVTFSTGVHVRSSPLNESYLDVVHRVMAYNDDTVRFASVDGIGSTILDVREVGIYLPDVVSLEVLARRAERQLVRLNQVATEQTLALDLVPGVPVPGLDVHVGDWVNYVEVGAKPLRRRLDSWSLTLDEEGVTTGTVVLDRAIRTRGIHVHNGMVGLRRLAGMLRVDLGEL